jgi:hypothetical protein
MLKQTAFLLSLPWLQIEFEHQTLPEDAIGDDIEDEGLVQSATAAAAAAA